MKSSSVAAIAAAVTLFLSSTALAAQQHSHADGAWALQFGIGDDFTLRAFEGAAISAIHHGSANRALRYGLTLSAGYRNSDEQPDESDIAAGIAIHFLRYPTLGRDPAGPIQMYWGFGPLLAFQLQELSDQDGESVTTRSLSVGAGATIGGEWFVRQRISLSAEYRSALTATMSSDPAADDWSIQLRQPGVLFGVAIWFP